MKVSLFSGIGWLIFRSYNKLSPIDIYYWLIKCWAELKLGIGEGFYPLQEITVTFYRFSKKAVITLPALEYIATIQRHENYRKIAHFGNWILVEALFEFMIVFTLGMILTYCFFMLQGRKSIVKNKIRGGELVTPKELTKYLKKNRIASSIKIGGLPIVKDSERQHILISGTTGSGKTNLLNELIPQIRSRNEKAIIVDMTGSFVQQYYDPNCDILLNPFDQRTADWLPWADCNQQYDYDSLASAISGESSLHDPFWDNSAAQITAEALKKNKP